MRPLLFLFCAFTSLHAGDWPQFLGPQRNCTAVNEAALVGSKEPEILWKRMLGSGHAGPVVSKDRVIVTHRQGDEIITEALTATDGKPLWRHAYPTRYHDSFGFDNGPRAVPCIAAGKVLTHGPEGIVQALDFETGQLLWSYDSVAELESPQGYFGRACSPMVVDQKVLLNVGGKNAKGGAGIIALDLATGKLIWQATDDEASYSSPVLLSADKAVSVFFTRRGILLTQNSDGKILADDSSRAEINASVNAAAPVLCGEDKLFFSAAYDVGAGLWQWNKAEHKLTNLWKKSDTLDCHYSTPVFHEGHIYGLHGRQESGMTLRCIDVADGRVTWEAPDRIPGGTLVLVGDKLLLHSESGELWVFTADPKKFDLLQRSQITRAGHRSHDAFANGLLYARDAEKMVAVKVQ